MNVCAHASSPSAATSQPPRNAGRSAISTADSALGGVQILLRQQLRDHQRVGVVVEPERLFLGRELARRPGLVAEQVVHGVVVFASIQPPDRRRPRLDRRARRVAALGVRRRTVAVRRIHGRRVRRRPALAARVRLASSSRHDCEHPRHHPSRPHIRVVERIAPEDRALEHPRRRRPRRTGVRESVDCPLQRRCRPRGARLVRARSTRLDQAIPPAPAVLRIAIEAHIRHRGVRRFPGGGRECHHRRAQTSGSTAHRNRAHVGRARSLAPAVTACRRRSRSSRRLGLLTRGQLDDERQREQVVAVVGVAGATDVLIEVRRTSTRTALAS